MAYKLYSIVQENTRRLEKEHSFFLFEGKKLYLYTRKKRTYYYKGMVSIDKSYDEIVGEGDQTEV